MTTTLPARRVRPPRRRRSALHRRSTPLTIAMLAALAYFLLPLFWLVVASTKNTQDLFTTFGLWFSRSPQLMTNIAHTFTHDDAVYTHWLLNTVIYAVTSSLGAALLAAAAGYGFAKYGSSRDTGKTGHESILRT